MDKHIAKYIGINDSNFIAIIWHSIDLYKWIQQKNSCKELFTDEEKILLEEKLEDIKVLSVRDDMKNQSAEMTLNESKIEVLTE
ncbi:7685_t:CDS:2, partial [Gigaspora margarita]